MRRIALGLALLVGASFGVPAATAGHDADVHSENMRLVANWDDDGAYRQGSDLAFWGNRAVVGNFGNPGGFWLLDISRPDRPRKIGQLECPGPQNDVSIWGDLVFLSVDSPRTGPECGAGAAPIADVTTGSSWEGVRVIDISDPADPEQIAAVQTDCGSHTHTLVPDVRGKDPRLLIYVSSYPLTGHYVVNHDGGQCAAHARISVIEVPLDDPASAEVVSQPPVAPAIGCHDITVFMPLELAAAACLTESQIWDISDPVNPAILSHIYNPAINIHHSSAWSWDGTKVILGDELGGALATPGCTGGQDVPVGAMWFYDVSDPAAPVVQSSYRIPRPEASTFCTAHNFNPVPLKNGKDILVSAWYNGGTTVVDFTDAANPVEIGHYNPKEGGVAAAWSSYWYNGHIYVNNFDEDVNSLTAHSRGFDVLEIDHPSLQRRDLIELPRLNPQTQERIPRLHGGHGKGR